MFVTLNYQKNFKIGFLDDYSPEKWRQTFKYRVDLFIFRQFKLWFGLEEKMGIIYNESKKDRTILEQLSTGSLDIIKTTR